MSTSPLGTGMRAWPAGGMRALSIILGVIWIILGLFVLAAPFITFVAALAFVWVFGLLLAVGGVLHTIHAFMVRGRGFLLYLLEGLLSVVVGVILMVDPVGGVIGLTLLIGIFLLVGGVMRVALGFMLRASGVWVWLLISGVLEFVLGLVIVSNWPGSAAWVIGTFIGIGMLFRGSTLLALGLAPRGAAPAAPI
jgi:uncharacterized membrane protein HdeD (DUF308 family)